MKCTYYLCKRREASRLIDNWHLLWRIFNLPILYYTTYLRGYHFVVYVGSNEVISSLKTFQIMNKGAPAGNVLRKQISFLPKYQITMTPIDEKRVSMQLVLLNQAYLAQNMEHLTARNTHKCYVVVGDSENYLICLTSFK